MTERSNMLTELIRINTIVDIPDFPRVEYSLRPDIYDALVGELGVSKEKAIGFAALSMDGIRVYRTDGQKRACITLPHGLLAEAMNPCLLKMSSEQ